jgi:hypothetical protein
VARKDKTPEERAERHVSRARLEMWGWLVFTVPYMIWFKNSVAVVGLLSVYALVITMKGVKAAAEAEVAGYANPRMDEDAAASTE